MNNRFKYLENIIIKTNDPKYLEINDKFGTVIGLPDTKDEERVYIIYFLLYDDASWAVPEKYLVTTGKFESEDSIYGK